ncbi:hypothetical protein [Nocardia vinacea]|uniref:hypothetical protein n=1 Tax=Nocardia vinacea TaxID=96468 RepID=UPI0012F6FFB6|nr:hypothetical protein [Nocardia vinacea]
MYDDNTKPRTVAQGIEPDSPAGQALEKYCGTVDYHDGHRLMRWESRDLLVSIGTPEVFGFASAEHLRGSASTEHLRVIQLGGHPTGYIPVTSISLPFPQLFYGHSCAGEELVVPDELDGDWRELAKRVLVPLLRPLRERPGFSRGVKWDESEESASYTPLIHDLDGNVFAMRYRPPRGALECLYLPEAIEDITPWLLAAFKEWSKEDSATFPAEPAWTCDPMWMTPAELAARAELDRQQEEAQRIIAEQDRKIAAAQAQLKVEQDAADADERILLTAGDDELVDAVESALCQLGFTVRNMDRQEGRRQKREDLRVVLDDWIAVCEVKGYTSGGKPADLQKLSRWVTLYAQESSGKLPSAQWYVVNQFRERDPNTRRPLLHGHQEDLDVLAEADGLAIDTRDLFRLGKAVALGGLTAEAARQRLISAKGRFTFSEND